jgi:hypothetical protein
MEDQCKEIARKNLAEFEERQKLIKAWREYCNLGYYMAQADVDTLVLYLGTNLSTEYMNRKISGDSISLKEFARDKGIKGSLPCL